MVAMFLFKYHTHTQSIEGSAPGSRITIEAIVANNVEFNYDMKLNAVAGVLFFNLLDGHFGKNVNRFRELLRPIDIQDAFSGTSFDSILKVFICVSG